MPYQSVLGGQKSNIPTGGGYKSVLDSPQKPSWTEQPKPANKSSLPEGFNPLPDGYGASNIQDPSSGKPLLTYESEAMKSSMLLSDRTALSFDFTKPQVIDRKSLTNGRMPESVSHEIKKSLGGTGTEELDHIMPLELGGSNDKMNLRLEPFKSGKKQTATDPIENQIKRDAISGKIPVRDAWIKMAQEKGIELPDLPQTKEPQGFFGKTWKEVKDVASEATKAVGRAGLAVGGFGVSELAKLPATQVIARVAAGDSWLKSILTQIQKRNDYTGEEIQKMTDLYKQSVSEGKPRTEAMKAARKEIQTERIMESGKMAVMGFLGAEDLAASAGKEAIGEISAQEARGIISKSAEAKGVEVFADQMAKDRALAEAVSMNDKRGLAGLNEEVKQPVVDWINRTKYDTLATKGKAAALKHTELDGEGLAAFDKIQSGETSGAYGKVRKFFDDWYKKLTDAGVDMGKRSNYLTQIWEDSLEKVSAVMGKQLSLHPGITREAVIANYQEGIKAGLTPKYKTVSQLVGYYESRAQKLLADTEFFREMSNGGFFQKYEKGASGWELINPKNFPLRTLKFGNVDYQGNIMAPAPLAEAINTYLYKPEGSFAEFMAKVGRIMSTLKNITMSVGIPKTGLGIHGFTELARSLGSSQGKARVFVITLTRMLRPSLAQKAFEDSIDHAAFLSDYGLKVSAEEHTVAPEFTDSSGFGYGPVGKTATKIKDTLYNLFGSNLFGKIIPAAKTEEAWGLSQDLIARGVPEREAYTKASEYVNNLYGGINYEALGRDKNWMNFWRVVAFAPDFAETNYNLAKGMVEGLMNPKNVMGKTYRSYLYTIATIYAGANALNYKTSGRLMWQNSYGHETDVAIGKDSQGRTIYFKPFGSSVDFARIPLEIAHVLLSGDINMVDDLMALLRNRLSKGVSAGIGALFNVDPFGNKITGPDKYGQPQSPAKQAANIGSEILGTFMPSSAANVPGLLGGTKSATQTILQGLGLPFAFRKENLTLPQINELKNRARQEVVDGTFGDKDSIFQKLVDAGVISRKGMRTFIKNARGKTAKQQRTAARRKKTKSRIMDILNKEFPTGI